MADEEHVFAHAKAIYGPVHAVARCQLPTPHRPHRHEINWGDLVGGYWCDGRDDGP